MINKIISVITLLMCLCLYMIMVSEEITGSLNRFSKKAVFTKDDYKSMKYVRHCGEVKMIFSQTAPSNRVGKTWGFGRIAGINVIACQPGQLSFITYRKKVKNTPSRWEVFINDQFLVSGLVNDQRESVEIDIKKPGLISLIFSNAYNTKDNMKERRTLYFENVQFVEKK